MNRALILTLALVGCSTPQTIVKEKIERVNVPVRVGCVTADVAKTVPLNQRYTAEQWASMTAAQKSAAVSAQGIRRMNEGDRLRASAAGCPPALSPLPSDAQHEKLARQAVRLAHQEQD